MGKKIFNFRVHIYDFISHAGDKVTFKVRKLDKNIEVKDKMKSAAKEIEKNGFQLRNSIPNYNKKM